MDKSQSTTSKILEMDRSMRVEVKIPHDEVDRLVINRLIGIRNFEGNRNLDMTHIDKTIKFFLSEEEFKKYAIEKKQIK